MTEGKVNYRGLNQQFMSKSFFEITTNIGCPINCFKFCPQEVLIKRYKGVRMMSLEVFKACLKDVPAGVGLIFSGFSEPFVNPDCLNMVKYAYAKGHKIVMNTTAVGMTKETVEELIKMKYYSFSIHLPYKNVTHIDITPAYAVNVLTLANEIPNVSFSLMNELFISNNRENVTRGILPRPKPVRRCEKLTTFQGVILPNADVYPCCMDFGLQHRLGNMITDGYAKVKDNWRRLKPFELCRYCTSNEAVISAKTLVRIYKALEAKFPSLDPYGHLYKSL